MADSLVKFVEGTKAKASEVNENFEYILQEMSTQIQNVKTYLEGEFQKISGNFVLPGTIIHVAYGSAPNGYLKCDGATYLRTEYPDLFAVIGTIYGSTDSTNFKVPNFQGQFLRGFGGNSASIGVAQKGGIPNITCSFGNFDVYGANASGAAKISSWGQSNTREQWGGAVAKVDIDASRSNKLFGASEDEIRPDNYAVMLCIKY